MLIKKEGCCTFNYATKAGEWWADVIVKDLILGKDKKTIVGFHTYKYWNEVKTPSICVGVSKNKRLGYVGMYLVEDRPILTGYAPVI